MPDFSPVLDHRGLVPLTDDQQALQEMIRSFAMRELAPLARDIDREQRFPRENWAKAAELGLLGTCCPEQYGGAGLGLTELCIIGEELAAACMSTSATIMHQADLVIPRFVRHGSHKQKARYLPGLCDGSSIGCLAITEPEAGSDAMAMATRARKTADGWTISGQKTFITTASEAQFALVYAVTGDPGSRNLGLFIVGADTPGFTRGRKFEKMGWRGSPTCELSFDECEVGDEALLGAADEGRRVLFSGLDTERVTMAIQSVGIANGAFRAALAYAQERRQFGRPISDFQLIRGKLADMYTEIQAARVLTYRAAAMADAGDLRGLTAVAAAAKLYASELCERVTTAAVQIFGGYGYINEFPVERMMRDARLMTIGGGTSEIMRHIISRELLRA